MDQNHHHDYWKKSGQIPAFGNWDYANELPITQYFECARQAGLIRYSNSSGDTDAYVARGDLYAVDNHHQKPHRAVDAPPAARKTKGGGGGGRSGEKRCGCPQGKEQKKHLQQQTHQAAAAPAKVKVVCDVTEQPRKLLRNDAVPRPLPRLLPKPVDEDLYKIPPELLQASKRKKRLGIFSRCLVPACTS